MEWFSVDKEGLAKLLARKGGDGGITGMAWLIFELIQNCLDTDTQNVHVKLTPIANKPYCELTVTDESSHGFKNLAHAWTLFAESEKKGDPTKRGRFNLGEKLVLALCEEATITSTTGSVTFDKKGRHTSKKGQDFGTTFHAIVRMTRAEYDEVCKAVQLLLVPEDVFVSFNGLEIKPRDKKSSFETTLPTEIADAEGVLRRSARKTEVSIYEPRQGETPMLYEMGIPVVELSGGEPWHINIGQKVPLNADRDNVTPAYMREVRTYVLNHMHPSLKGKEEAAKTWVREAMTDPRIEKDAFEKAKTEAFGKDTVSYDPSDPQANKAAAAEGYTVIPGGALPAGAWDNAKRFGVVAPAGRVFPTHPEHAEDAVIITADEQSAGMKQLAQFTQAMADVLINLKVSVLFINNPRASMAASWSGRQITFNVGRLGKKWFDEGPTEAQVDLIIHEFGHHYEGDHLSEKYYRALTRLGAKLAFWCAKYPDLLTEKTWKKT